MDSNSFDLIPMRKTVVFFAIVMLLLTSVLTIHSYPDIDPKFLLSIPIAVVCYLGLAWDSLRSYRLDDSGITVYRFGKVITKISWNQVAQIGIARTDGWGKGRAATFLLIVPKGCEPFDPVTDLGYSYRSRNSQWVLTFDPPQKYRAIFEKYYGPIDFDVTQYRIS